MTPIAKNKQFNKVELYVAKDNTLAGGKIFEKNGAQYTYEITSISPNAAVADNLFTWNAKQHAKVEVVDLR
jgi:outer membrane lipoprotein-sorting protein